MFYDSKEEMMSDFFGYFGKRCISISSKTVTEGTLGIQDAEDPYIWKTTQSPLFGQTIYYDFIYKVEKMEDYLIIIYEF